MSPQMTFDEVAPHPHARRTDPPSSHEAAAAVALHERRRKHAIRVYLWRWGPCTAFRVAQELAGELGVQEDTVRAAVSRMALDGLDPVVVHDRHGVSPGGRKGVQRFRCADDPYEVFVEVRSDVL